MTKYLHIPAQTHEIIGETDSGYYLGPGAFYVLKNMVTTFLQGTVQVGLPTEPNSLIRYEDSTVYVMSPFGLWLNTITGETFDSAEMPLTGFTVLYEPTNRD